MQIGEVRKELDYALLALQEDYKACVKVVRKTFAYLEQVGVKEFNKYSKYKWSLDRESGYSYVCVRYGSSLKKKSLIKGLAHLEDPELYKWIENKDMICEALDEACEYIRARVKTLKRKMGETRASIMEYEEKLNNLEDGEEDLPSGGGSKVMRVE